MNKNVYCILYYMVLYIGTLNNYFLRKLVSYSYHIGAMYYKGVYLPKYNVDVKKTRNIIC